ncbi:MAG: YncE family protein [Planctomycetes bacterium]|nr:YncE family protein [Planctomycetota bacterium]
MHLPPTAFAPALALLLAAATPRAQDPVDRLLVCNKADHTVSIFDPRTREQLAVLPTGEGPHEVAISPDGRTAVVSDYGAQKPGRTLTVVDVLAAKVTNTITLAGRRQGDDGEQPFDYLRPHGIQFVAPGVVLLTSERARRLARVELASGTVTADWTTPQTTMHMVALDPAGRFAAATSIREGSLALFAIDGETDAGPRIVPTGDGAEGLAVRPGSDVEVWVGNRAANTVSIVDPATGKVTATLDTAEFPFRIAFTPDGGKAVVSCAEGGVVAVFDAAKRELAESISITADGSEQGAMPMGLCLDPDGARCYVACGRGEFVAVIDLAAGRVVDRLKAGAGPDGIGYARIAAAGTDK